MLRLPEKVDRKFEGLMKVLVKITYKQKYLKKEEVQGSSKRAGTWVECPQGKQPWVSIQTSSKSQSFCEGKRARTSVECPKDNNLELTSRHQVRDAVLKGKGTKPWLSVQRMTINLQSASRHQVSDVDFCLCNYTIW